MTKVPKTRTFIVTRTHKLKDSLGNYCYRGQECQLSQVHAEHFQKKGLIQVTMNDLYKDEPEPAAATTASAGQPADTPSGTDDEAEASADAEDDAGASADEAGAKTPFNRRRKRAAS